MIKEYFREKRVKRLKRILDYIGQADYVISEDGRSWDMSQSYKRTKDPKYMGVFFG